MTKGKFSVKWCVLLPIVLIVTIFLWAVPVSFYGIEGLTVVQQRMKFTGHCDYKSMKPYIDITESAKKDAIKKMEEAFKKK